jgi:hypothetical protein
MMKIIFVLPILLTMSAYGQDNSTSGKVQFDSELSYKLLEPTYNLRKVHVLMTERKEKNSDDVKFIIGASLISIFDYQKSNTDSKFSYLMRHPTPSNQIGKEVSEAVVHSFQMSVTGQVNSWLGLHTEILYNPEQSFGAGTITALGRNQLQLRKGFVVLGDLNEFPVYGAIGKMDAPFGQTGSVSPFTNSTMWHAFGGLGYGAQVGFDKWGLNASFMLVQGGAQFRAMHTVVGDSTNVPSKLNNFTGDINYTLKIAEKHSVKIGGSYMHGSAYCQDFPVTHFAACGDNNPAVTYYGQVKLFDRIELKGGFATTLKVWNGTHNPTPPLDIYAAAKVSSLDYGAKFDFNVKGDYVYSLSGEFSNFRAGAVGAPWERQNQIVIGLSTLYKKSSKIFVELFRTDGYAPLNFISGSDPFAPFPPGVTHSLATANSMGIVIGAQLTL